MIAFVYPARRMEKFVDALPALPQELVGIHCFERPPGSEDALLACARRQVFRIGTTAGCGAGDGPERGIPDADPCSASGLRSGRVGASSCPLVVATVPGPSTPRDADAVASENDDTKATPPR